ncbi:hypothetical protein RESH_00927 [Rhodopirellula europaea SH398]|uniref:Uncharacterized protein n=1 Tax=Rhodopirellula europaea SH398 TaxID=1263868 RepID=M5SL30_9BACT|nr:hypothetical protein RESH_00927 [Rhodopirellula europaea SH398]
MPPNFAEEFTPVESNESFSPKSSGSASPSRLGRIAFFGLLVGGVLSVAFLFISQPRNSHLREQKIDRAEGGDSSASVAGATFANDRFDSGVATSILTPVDVVQKQLEAMRLAASDPDQLVTCYSLASAGNRATTGPFNRFCKLFEAPPFDLLIGHREAMVGRASMDGGKANVMVTVITANNESLTYGFVLTTQSSTQSFDRNTQGSNEEDGSSLDESSSPLEKCWMTEAVFPI